MYTAYFGLTTTPFALTPDPHFLYLSERHREALAHLLYGANEGSGFVLLTGEVGTGKTTLCRCLIEQLPPTVDIALLLNPRLTSTELLAAIFDELRIAYNRTSFSLRDYIDTLNTYLLTAHSVGRRTVLILDEAQNLSPDVLEQVRLLTNLETASTKLLQIILVGQPELNTLLKRTNLRQLSQRITARYHLLPLSAKDTKSYVNHRLSVSGARKSLFTGSATRLIHHYSGGVPRLINIICDRSLLGGYVNHQNPVGKRIVHRAVQEIKGENVVGRSHLGWLTTLLFLTILLAGGFLWWNKQLTPILPTTKLVDLPIEPAPLQTTNFAESKLETSTVGLPSALKATEAETTDLPTTLPALLHAKQTDNHASAAFSALFNQWQMDFQGLQGKTACEKAKTKGLLCIHRTGTWKDIRYYNRPTVIELVTDRGEPLLATVTRLRDQVATISFLGQTFELPLKEIQEYWLGQFLLLWHPPSLPPPTLRRGKSDKAVVWLRKSLNTLAGKSSNRRLSSRFDNKLRKKVITFQREQKLVADGVVGEKTFLVLNTLLGVSPRLW